MTLRWTASAHIDRVAIFDYIEQDSFQAAKDLDDVLLQAAESLRHFPEIGRMGRIRGTREYPVRDTPYLLLYTINNHAVRILRVIHGARRWPKKMPQL